MRTTLLTSQSIRDHPSFWKCDPPPPCSPFLSQVLSHAVLKITPPVYLSTLCPPPPPPCSSVSRINSEPHDVRLTRSLSFCVSNHPVPPWYQPLRWWCVSTSSHVLSTTRAPFPPHFPSFFPLSGIDHSDDGGRQPLLMFYLTTLCPPPPPPNFPSHRCRPPRWWWASTSSRASSRLSRLSNKVSSCRLCRFSPVIQQPCTTSPFSPSARPSVSCLSFTLWQHLVHSSSRSSCRLVSSSASRCPVLFTITPSANKVLSV